MNDKKMNDKEKARIDFTPLFFPKTMAVIGASNNPVGAVKYVKGHKDTPIKVFPVNTNLRLKELEGLKVYHSLDEIPVDIDLAIIGVPKQHVPGVIRSFKTKLVKFAVIFTSGFEESGNDDLAMDLRASISEVGTRFIGPNCLGLYVPRAKLVYFPGHSVNEEDCGNIAFISQSGGHTAKTNTFLRSRGASFSKTISIGNSVDLTPEDFLPYFKDDPDTVTVGLYLESTGNGRELMKQLKNITPVKPVVIWKGGKGEVGVQATASHTGKLAGNYRMWKTVCKQTGTILADNFEVFADLLTMFSYKISVPKSRNVALVACGGGNAVEAADLFEAEGFKIPELSKETKERIYEFIPEVNTSLRNPVDLGEYGYVPKRFADALKIISEDENIDSLVYIKESSRFPMFSVNFLITTEKYEDETVKHLVKAHGHNQKRRNIPFYVNDPFITEALDGFKCRVSFRERMSKEGIPVFSRIDSLMKAIKHAQKYSEFLQKHGYENYLT
ncbi:MAG: CoA-binding protein [Promethearchaeota archaeon]